MYDLKNPIDALIDIVSYLSRTIQLLGIDRVHEVIANKQHVECDFLRSLARGNLLDGSQ